MTYCEKCGEEMDTCCGNGQPRCPDCDGPCPCCSDGGGPFEYYGDDPEDDPAVEGDEDAVCPRCDMNNDDQPNIEGGDICTHDHCTFYQYGKVVLQISPDDNHVAALRAFMDKERHWPSCWVISDHGNAHLIDLTVPG